MKPSVNPSDMGVPPWSSAQLWKEANAATSSLLGHCGGKATVATQLSHHIRHSIEALDHPMTALCRETCPTCSHPCCLRATVWFDFRDLIYLHSCGEPIPGGQIIAKPGYACQYLAPFGCVLSRTQRPFVCTWYICPQQWALIRKHPGSHKKDICRHLDSIKRYRRKLEQWIIGAVG